MNFLERIRQKPEGQRRFLMFVSMTALSFLVLAIAWKSLELNLSVRFGDDARQNKTAASGPLLSIAEDIKRIAKGGESALLETGDAKQNASGGWIERIFSAARKVRLIINYNTDEMQKWLAEVLRQMF